MLRVIFRMFADFGGLNRGWLMTGFRGVGGGYLY
jgi:hypothetical protein